MTRGARHDRQSHLSELKAILRRLKLSPMLDTLPERVALARQKKMPHQDFLELVLADEVTRRDSKSAVVRAQRANLDPTMVLDSWDDSSGVIFDHELWSELTRSFSTTSSRRLESSHESRWIGHTNLLARRLCARAASRVRPHRPVADASMARVNPALLRSPSGPPDCGLTPGHGAGDSVDYQPWLTRL